MRCNQNRLLSRCEFLRDFFSRQGICFTCVIILVMSIFVSCRLVNVTLSSTVASAVHCWQRSWKVVCVIRLQIFRSTSGCMYLERQLGSHPRIWSNQLPTNMNFLFRENRPSLPTSISSHIFYLTDCSRTCKVGTLSRDCRSCTCEGHVITGRITDEYNRPLQGVKG